MLAKKDTVLLVKEDDAVRSFVGTLLREANLNALEAREVTAALQTLASSAVDIAIR